MSKYEKAPDCANSSEAERKVTENNLIKTNKICRICQFPMFRDSEGIFCGNCGDIPNPQRWERRYQP